MPEFETLSWSYDAGSGPVKFFAIAVVRSSANFAPHIQFSPKTA